MRLISCSIAQKHLTLQSKLELEVKTIGQELWNKILYVSIAQVLLEIQQTFWKKQLSNFRVSVKNGKITIQNREIKKIQKNDTFLFWSYLQKYLSYRDVQYLILKLETNCFDLLLSILALRVIFLDLQSKIHV